MQAIKSHEQTQASMPATEKLPPYVPPAIISYTDEQLLEALGPAQAGGIYSPFIGP